MPTNELCTKRPALHDFWNVPSIFCLVGLQLSPHLLYISASLRSSSVFCPFLFGSKAGGETAALLLIVLSERCLLSAEPLAEQTSKHQLHWEYISRSYLTPSINYVACAKPKKTLHLPFKHQKSGNLIITCQLPALQAFVFLFKDHPEDWFSKERERAHERTKV